LKTEWRAEWPDEFVKKSPKMSPNQLFLSKLMHTWYRGKSSSKIYVIFKTLPKVNNRQLCKNSPNLVTLMESPLLCKAEWQYLVLTRLYWELEPKWPQHSRECDQSKIWALPKHWNCFGVLRPVLRSILMRSVKNLSFAKTCCMYVSYILLRPVLESIILRSVKNLSFTIIVHDVLEL
jgi:hypothetical protein